MGLDARRGAGFPPELYEDILQGWKTKRERSRQAHCASRRRKLVRNGGSPCRLGSDPFGSEVRLRNAFCCDAGRERGVGQKGGGDLSDCRGSFDSEASQRSNPEKTGKVGIPANDWEFVWNEGTEPRPSAKEGIRIERKGRGLGKPLEEDPAVGFLRLDVAGRNRGLVGGGGEKLFSPGSEIEPFSYLENHRPSRDVGFGIGSKGHHRSPFRHDPDRRRPCRAGNLVTPGSRRIDEERGRKVAGRSPNPPKGATPLHLPHGRTETDASSLPHEATLQGPKESGKIDIHSARLPRGSSDKCGPQHGHLRTGLFRCEVFHHGAKGVHAFDEGIQGAEITGGSEEEGIPGSGELALRKSLRRMLEEWSTGSAESANGCPPMASPEEDGRASGGVEGRLTLPFQENDRAALLGKVKRGGQAGDSSADDQDVDSFGRHLLLLKSLLHPVGERVDLCLCEVDPELSAFELKLGKLGRLLGRLVALQGLLLPIAKRLVEVG